MNMPISSHALRDLRSVLLILVALLLIVAAAVIGITQANRATASSHREAPLIAQDPYADNTDVYAFVSPDVTDTVTLIGSWIPGEFPEGGPNYYHFADDVLYELHVDNVGDGQSHITYQFDFRTTVNNPNTFLYNTGAVSTTNDPDLNVRQTFTVTEIMAPLAGSPVTTVLGSNLPVPPVNVGGKSMSTGDYEAMFAAGVHNVTGGIKVFAGQTDDPFWVDLGAVFDLLSLRPQAPPVGYGVQNGGTQPGLDALSGFNVHSIAMQVPIAHLLTNTDPVTNTVVGVWATSSRQSTRTLSPLGGVAQSGSWVQISRLGMPLVNEAVIPLALKDAFNGLKPEQDLSVYLSTPLLQQSVLTPELQTLLNALYSVPNPGKPRDDIFGIFLTGFQLAQPFTITTPTGNAGLPIGFNVNKFSSSSAQPAEELRLNTAFRPGAVCPTATSPNKPNYHLGLLAGDACGFPNGRRLQDDVIDIELLAVAGAAWQVTTGDTSFSMNPALASVLDDGLYANDVPFRSAFPYLAAPHSGQHHSHTNLYWTWLLLVFKNAGGLQLRSR
jgi:hypothetical protein